MNHSNFERDEIGFNDVETELKIANGHNPYALLEKGLFSKTVDQSKILPMKYQNLIKNKQISLMAFGIIMRAFQKGLEEAELDRLVVLSNKVQDFELEETALLLVLGRYNDMDDLLNWFMNLTGHEKQAARWYLEENADKDDEIVVRGINNNMDQGQFNWVDHYHDDIYRLLNLETEFGFKLNSRETWQLDKDAQRLERALKILNTPDNELSKKNSNYKKVINIHLKDNSLTKQDIAVAAAKAMKRLKGEKIINVNWTPSEK